jgi:hypothetical protein
MEVRKKQRGPKIGRLTTVMEVAAELGKIYRDARHEKIEAGFANRLANILSALRQCLETAEFERRIAEIEAMVGKSIPTSSAVFDVLKGARSDPTGGEAQELDPMDLPSDRRH